MPDTNESNLDSFPIIFPHVLGNWFLGDWQGREGMVRGEREGRGMGGRKDEWARFNEREGLFLCIQLWPIYLCPVYIYISVWIQAKWKAAGNADTTKPILSLPPPNYLYPQTNQ